MGEPKDERFGQLSLTATTMKYIEGAPHASSMIAYVLGIRRKDGGTCEHCGRSQAVILVLALDMWLCSACLRGWDGR